MAQISRDPEDLVAQTVGRHHQYPDGLVLFLGTLFAPTEDRGEKGAGFTHHLGDVVSISAEGLGDAPEPGGAVHDLPGMDLRRPRADDEPRRARADLTAGDRLAVAARAVHKGGRTQLRRERP